MSSIEHHELLCSNMFLPPAAEYLSDNVAVCAPCLSIPYQSPTVPKLHKPGVPPPHGVSILGRGFHPWDPCLVTFLTEAKMEEWYRHVSLWIEVIE